jgi:protein phosphatase
MSNDSARWKHCLEHIAISDVGIRRANNQDSFTTVLADDSETWRRRGHLFMVADGMGAHAAGELASKLATDTVALTYHKRLDLAPPEAILAATVEANNQIHARGQASPDFQGMGTTGTALLLVPQGALLAHVGDSRAYRLRGNRLEQLTFDHSLVWEMRRAGNLGEGEVPGFIGKNVITRSLGPNESVEVDIEGPHPLAVGDTFLLCSDGLSGQVEDHELGTILMSLPVEEAARSLIDLANLRGGPDNITVVIAKVTDPILTEASDDPPMPGQPRPVHPLIWMLLAVAALASGAMLVLGQVIGALIGLIVAVVTSVVAVALRYTTEEAPRLAEGRAGQGPYAAVTCGATGQFVGELTEMIAQLHEAATREKWDVDLPAFERLSAEARAAADQGDHAGAVRGYLKAIRWVMDHLKRRRRGTAG